METWMLTLPLMLQQTLLYQEMVLVTSEQWSKLQCLPRPWQLSQGLCSFIFKEALWVSSGLQLSSTFKIQGIYDLLTELTPRMGVCVCVAALAYV